MTANQIAYWRLQEDRRHNMASLEETNRSNVAREIEANRSNVAKETETIRSNLAKEAISSKQADASMKIAESSESQAKTAQQRADVERLYAPIYAAASERSSQAAASSAAAAYKNAVANENRVKYEYPWSGTIYGVDQFAKTMKTIADVVNVVGGFFN